MKDGILNVFTLITLFCVRYSRDFIRIGRGEGGGIFFDLVK